MKRTLLGDKLIKDIGEFLKIAYPAKKPFLERFYKRRKNYTFKEFKEDAKRVFEE